MKPNYSLETLLSAASPERSDRLAFFALINLGLIESLAHGLVSAAQAVSAFYHAENCLYTKKILKDKIADRIMSHGVQLPDLFDCLPTETAQREFLHELATMRSLCLKLLERTPQVA